MADFATQAAAALADGALATKAFDFDEQALTGLGAPGPDLPLVPPPAGDAVLDPVTGQWTPLRPGNYEARAVRGEQNMGFALPQEKGWVFISGPSGTGPKDQPWAPLPPPHPDGAGHRYNAPAEDGAAFNLEGEFHLFILDNKAEARKTVRKATALTDNRPSTLKGLQARVKDPSFDDVPRIERVRKALDAAVAADAQGLARPADVTLGVTNLGGRSTRVSTKLTKAGVRLIDLAGNRRPAALASPPASVSVAKALAPSAVGAGAGLIAGWLTDKLLQSLEIMPPPTAKPGSIWSEDGVKDRLPLDLVATHLAEAPPELENRRGRLAAEMLAGWAEADRVPEQDRAAVLARMRQRIVTDQAELVGMAQNVDQALALEPQMTEAVAACRDLLAMLDNPHGFKAAFDVGFTIEHLSRLGRNLAWYSASLDRSVLAPLRHLRRRIQEAQQEDERTLGQIDAAESSPEQRPPQDRRPAR